MKIKIFTKIFLLLQRVESESMWSNFLEKSLRFDLSDENECSCSLLLSRPFRACKMQMLTKLYSMLLDHAQWRTEGGRGDAGRDITPSPPEHMTVKHISTMAFV